MIYDNQRDRRIIYNKSGKSSYEAKINIPIAWLEQLGIKREDNESNNVKLIFDVEQQRIIIQGSNDFDPKAYEEPEIEEDQYINEVYTAGEASRIYKTSPHSLRQRLARGVNFRHGIDCRKVSVRRGVMSRSSNIMDTP